MDKTSDQIVGDIRTGIFCGDLDNILIDVIDAAARRLEVLRISGDFDPPRGSTASIRKRLKKR